MKSHVWIALIVILYVAGLYNFGRFTPLPEADAGVPDAAQLRAEALQHGMGSIPKRWEDAKRLVETPEHPLTPQKIALGQRLFFDPVLSKDRTINCASCHDLSKGGDDGRPTAVGYRAQRNPHHLNAPTVFNAALAKRQFWDGRSPDVEDQAKGPIQAPFEMAMTPREVVERLKADASYAEAFDSVFPRRGITFDTVTEAIGAYERTLLTRSAYDRFLDGDDDAIGLDAKRGFSLFMQLGCKGCHTGVSVGGQSLQTFPLRPYRSPIVPHSVYVNGKRYFRGFTLGKLSYDSPYPFPDVGGFHGKNGMFRFRVPVLRNVTRTAPYFHNGSVEKLEEAVRIMARHQLGIDLNTRQIAQIVAFLKTLEGDPAAFDIR